jgi:hypothetical protein
MGFVFIASLLRPPSVLWLFPLILCCFISESVHGGLNAELVEH